jgi:hypothetical protein
MYKGEEMSMLNPKLSSDIARVAAAKTTGKKCSLATIEKMRESRKFSREHWAYPPKCMACESRDDDMCARFNMLCYDAKDTMCFKRYPKRKIHPDYIKKAK